MRATIRVRPGSGHTVVGGRYDEALVVRVRERAVDGRAPDVFRRGGTTPMRCFRDEDTVDFAVVGAGAGGATLAAKLGTAPTQTGMAFQPSRLRML